jgi:hypothetical protein
MTPRYLCSVFGGRILPPAAKGDGGRRWDAKEPTDPDGADVARPDQFVGGAPAAAQVPGGLFQGEHEVPMHGGWAVGAVQPALDDSDRPQEAALGAKPARRRGDITR